MWSDLINSYKYVLYSKIRFLENYFYVVKNLLVINFLLLVKVIYIIFFGNENLFNVIFLICFVLIICNIVVYIYIYICIVYMYFGCDYYC